MIRIGDLREIPNTDRKFGAASTYFLARLQLDDKSEVYAMFTHDQIETAIARAKANQEDIEAPGFWDRVQDKLD